PRGHSPRARPGAGDVRDGVAEPHVFRRGATTAGARPRVRRAGAAQERSGAGRAETPQATETQSRRAGRDIAIEGTRRNSMIPRLLLGACCLCAVLPGAVSAASRTLKPGQVLGISEDVVLAGDDVLEVNGTREKPCRIDANGQQIRTKGDWRGRIRVRHCEFRGLGSAKI